MKSWLSLQAARLIWISGMLWGAEWAMARLKREGLTNADLARMPRY